MTRYVLDSSALMALFEDRPGAKTVEDLLREATRRQERPLMSVINWGEVYYSLWKIHGQEVGADKLEEIVTLRIEVLDVDMTTTKLAAALKATYRLPYADCFAAAVAQQREATLVTTDKDFNRVQGEINILWASAARK